LSAVIGPAHTSTNLPELFGRLEAIRERVRKQKGVASKALIEEGRT